MKIIAIVGSVVALSATTVAPQSMSGKHDATSDTFVFFSGGAPTLMMGVKRTKYGSCPIKKNSAGNTQRAKPVFAVY